MALFILPWIFDVRSVAGLEWLRFIQLGSFLFCTAIFLIAVRILRTRDRSLGSLAGNSWNLAVVALFAVTAFVAGIVGHNALFQVFSLTIPAILFCYSLVFIALLARAKMQPNDFMDILVALAVATILIRIPLIALLFNINFSTVRYQILSGATIFGSAYVVARVAAGFRTQDIIFAVIHTAIVLLSVTRIQLLSVATMGLSLFLTSLRTMLRPKVMLSIVAAVFVGVLAIYSLASSMSVNPITRWIARTTISSNAGVDMSTLAREAQVLYEIRQLAGGGTLNKLIGFGIAAKGGNIPELEAFAISHGVRGSYVPIGFADHTYVSFLYLGGLIGGGPILLIQFSWLWNALRAIAFISKKHSRHILLITPPLAVIGYQTYNMFGATFIDRNASVFLGLSVGMTSWICAIRKREKAAARRA